jgi:hypothetical protein
MSTGLLNPSSIGGILPWIFEVIMHLILFACGVRQSQPEGESNAGWHIEIEHIQSGVKSTFDQLEDLLTMLCEKRQELEVKKELTRRM